MFPKKGPNFIIVQILVANRMNIPDPTGFLEKGLPPLMGEMGGCNLALWGTRQNRNPSAPKPKVGIFRKWCLWNLGFQRAVDFHGLGLVALVRFPRVWASPVVIGGNYGNSKIP